MIQIALHVAERKKEEEKNQNRHYRNIKKRLQQSKYMRMTFQGNRLLWSQMTT